MKFNTYYKMFCQLSGVPISPPVSQFKTIITASTAEVLFVLCSFSLFGKSSRGAPVIHKRALVNRDTQSDCTRKSYSRLQNLIGGE
jgi:hypothetical protein